MAAKLSYKLDFVWLVLRTGSILVACTEYCGCLPIPALSGESVSNILPDCLMG